MQNRRRHKRIKIDSTAIITVLKEDSVLTPFLGFVIQISYGGIGICATQPAEVNNEIELGLTLIDIEGKKRHETIQGRIVWQKKAPSFYIFGVQFTSLNKKDHPKLVSYLEAEKKEGEKIKR